MKTSKTRLALSIGALGVVFGDIGTSPLYAFRAIFGLHGERMAVNSFNIEGILSLIIWSLTLVVSVKYVAFIMRADNEGEGGIMAFVGLVGSSQLRKKFKWFFVLVGLLGLSLFYGDSVITPAISVLSAVEGMKVVTPSLASYVVPITLVVLAGLFAIQRFGTGVIGRLFGPVMLTWFGVIGVAGAWQVVQHPMILKSLSPLSAVQFFVQQPGIAFVSMTAVVLAITGAEALYADMGHFGRKPIAKAWFFVVFPALALCYMGQGALLLHEPLARQNPFLFLFPHSTQIPVIILATGATLIASQSVISGAFSLTRQATHLDFLPKMIVRHTSNRETGQIYMPFISALLFVAVATLVVAFGSSEKLASAYGIAVSGTLAADSILFLVVLRAVWQRSVAVVIAVGLLFVPLDLLFISANSSKILHGGWFPLLIGALAFTLITTWLKGQTIVVAERRALEGKLQAFADEVHGSGIVRTLGHAIYVGHHPDYVPLALRTTYEDAQQLPEQVTIVSVAVTNAAHQPQEQRAQYNSLRYDDGISHVQLTYGFHDHINVPRELASLRQVSPELNFDPHKAAYYVSLTRIVRSKRHNMAGWRKSLYALMARNELATSDDYKLPIANTEEVYSLIKL